MSASAVSLHCPHASEPTFTTEVFINEHTPGRGLHGWSRLETSTHTLTVPPPCDWTPDHVRATLEALRRYLPAHDPATAEGRIDLHGKRPVKNLVLSVRARGWEAQAYVPSLRKTCEDAYDTTGSRLFSEPMLEALRDLRSRSPFAVAALRPVAVAITPGASTLSLAEASQRTNLAIATLLQRLPADKKDAFLMLMRDAINHAGDDDRDEE